MAPERKAHSLIAETNARGGLANITVITIQVVAADDSQTATTQQIPTPE